MKKIYKYGTGYVVPEGSIYLSTVVQEVHETIDNIASKTTRLVWHYFLVETDNIKDVENTTC